MITRKSYLTSKCTNPSLCDFWKRSHRPSFVDRTLLATLTTCTSHSVHLPKLSYLLSPLGKGRTPPYRSSFAAVCKYEKREGSSSQTTDRGASYRIPQPFVFAIRDYVTTMIHDDIYFGICSAQAVVLSFLPGNPSWTLLSSRATRICAGIMRNK